MKADLIVLDLAAADIPGRWQEFGSAAELGIAEFPLVVGLNTYRLGSDKERREVVLIQPKEPSDFGPLLAVIVENVEAQRVLVLERVLSVTRILNPGDVVIPSEALALGGATSPSVESLISRQFYAELVRASSVETPARVFHRGSYCAVTGSSGIDAYLLEQGYNLGFEVAGRGLSGVREYLPDEVELASICLVDRVIGSKGKVKDIDPFSRTVCSILIELSKTR